METKKLTGTQDQIDAAEKIRERILKSIEAEAAQYAADLPDTDQADQIRFLGHLASQQTDAAWWMSVKLFVIQDSYLAPAIMKKAGASMADYATWKAGK